MIKKLLSVAALGALLASSAFGDDFLAKVSNGALSDNSAGVKVLSLNEMKEVKGGYEVRFLYNGSQWTPTTESYAVALYTGGELQYIANYLNHNDKAPQGLCGIDQTSCSNPSKNRLTSFFEVTQGSIKLLPSYIVKRQVKVSDLGRPYVLFTYGVGAYDPNTSQLYKFNSSPMLNNNMIIKEIANKYKEQMESALGGWYPYRSKR
ncbi:bacteriocin [Campylobacter estrildidarum]|uniref:Bacteriocin n=1 Tax=Campylobacter estrildidarum TaxID=2510189 RepID=A0A4U7BN09_9BACT|nr:bacteriocin [Campylobacter estrildidarum]TKX30024.1 bacteriocin [Campylobacter estrildidarum]